MFWNLTSNKEKRLTENPSFLASFEVSFVKSRLTVIVFLEATSPSKSKAIFWSSVISLAFYLKKKKKKKKKKKLEEKDFFFVILKNNINYNLCNKMNAIH